MVIDKEVEGLNERLKTLLAQRKQIQHLHMPKKRKGQKDPITR